MLFIFKSQNQVIKPGTYFITYKWLWVHELTIKWNWKRNEDLAQHKDFGEQPMSSPGDPETWESQQGHMGRQITMLKYIAAAARICIKISPTLATRPNKQVKQMGEILVKKLLHTNCNTKRCIHSKCNTFFLKLNIILLCDPNTYKQQIPISPNQSTLSKHPHLPKPRLFLIAKIKKKKT